MSQPLKTLAKGAGIVFLGLIVSKLFTYLYRIIVARMGPEEYGLLLLATTVMSIVGAIPLLGLNAGVVRYVASFNAKKQHNKSKKTIATSLWVTIALSIPSAIALYSLANLISIHIFHDPSLTILIKIVSVGVILFNITHILTSTFEAYQKIQYTVIVRNIVESVSKVILTLLLLHLGYGLLGATISYTLAITITTLTALFLFNKRIFPLKKLVMPIDKPIFRKVIYFSLPVMFGTFLYQFLFWTDTIMLGYFKDASNVGIYNAAVPIAQLLTVIPFAIISLFVPVMTDLFSKGKSKALNNTLRISTKWIYTINAPLLGLFILYPETFIRIIFGGEYIQAKVSLVILSFGYFIYMISMTFDRMLNVIKRTDLLLINTLLIVVLNTALNIILIPPFGITGAGIATATSLIIYAVLLTGEMYALKRIWVFGKHYIKPTVSIFIACWVAHYAPVPVGLLQLLIGSAVFGGVYLLTLIATKPFEDEEITIMHAIAKKCKLPVHGIIDLLR